MNDFYQPRTGRLLGHSQKPRWQSRIVGYRFVSRNQHRHNGNQHRLMLLVAFALLGSFSRSGGAAQMPSTPQDASPSGRATNPLRPGLLPTYPISQTPAAPSATNQGQGPTTPPATETNSETETLPPARLLPLQDPPRQDRQLPGPQLHGPNLLGPGQDAPLTLEEQSILAEITPQFHPDSMSPNASHQILEGTLIESATHPATILPKLQNQLPKPPPGGRVLNVNPLAVQQGLAHLAFNDNRGNPNQRLGVPFSSLPSRFYDRIPRLKMSLDFPQERSSGRGSPLKTGSWLNRPYHADFFVGGWFSSDLIPGDFTVDGGSILGARVGWDINHYIGTEFRIATATGNIASDLTRSSVGEMDVNIYDLRWQYYPWGDSKVRPYTSFGIGIAEYELQDSVGNSVGATTVNLPISLGLKYYFRPWLIARFEVEDNISFGSSQLDAANSFNMTAGFEYRFGGRRRTYYPFTAGKYVR